MVKSKLAFEEDKVKNHTLSLNLVIYHIVFFPVKLTFIPHFHTVHNKKVHYINLLRTCISYKSIIHEKEKIIFIQNC